MVCVLKIPGSYKNYVTASEVWVSSCSETFGGGRNWSCWGPPGGVPLRLLSLSVADAISSTNPRVIDDARARKLSSDLKRCTYYETCATYGLNVERVFQDGECSLL